MEGDDSMPIAQRQLERAARLLQLTARPGGLLLGPGATSDAETHPGTCRAGMAVVP